VGVATVGLSWLVVHTVFRLRYALLYYTAHAGEIEFNQHSPPRYSDFAYLAFTLGMTFQVSDTDLQTPHIRATALRHALLSYLFGAVILATSINLVAGLARCSGDGYPRPGSYTSFEGVPWVTLGSSARAQADGRYLEPLVRHIPRPLAPSMAQLQLVSFLAARRSLLTGLDKSDRYRVSEPNSTGGVRVRVRSPGSDSVARRPLARIG
jgi:Protein of unknown function (DUF1345)